MFSIETSYDQPCLRAMAKAMRKSVRRKRSRITRILGCLLIAAVVWLWIPILLGDRSADAGNVVSLVTVIAMALVMWQEDRLNALIAAKRMLPHLKSAQTTFTDEGYCCLTEAATTEWKYSTVSIAAICDVGNYVVFVLNKTFAQAYDKRTLSGGSIEEFYRFLTEKTGKTVEKI